MNKKGIGLRPLVMNIILVVLFSLFIFTFASNMIGVQNPDSEVLGEKYGLNESKTKMDHVIGNFTATQENVFKQMSESEPTAVDYIFLIFKGAFYIPLAFLSFIFTGMTAIVTTIFPALSGTGMGDIVGVALSIIFSSIIITVVLLIVKAVRTGESER